MSFLVGVFSALGYSFTTQWLQKLSQMRKSIQLVHHHLLPAICFSLYTTVHCLFSVEQLLEPCCNTLFFLPLFGGLFLWYSSQYSPTSIAPVRKKKKKKSKQELPKSVHWVSRVLLLFPIRLYTHFSYNFLPYTSISGLPEAWSNLPCS